MPPPVNPRFQDGWHTEVMNKMEEKYRPAERHDQYSLTLKIIALEPPK